MRRKSKRDRNRTQTVMLTAPTTTENSAAAPAKNGYPAMPKATMTTQLRVGKTPTMAAVVAAASAAAGRAAVVEDVNKTSAPASMSSAAAAIVIVHHHHKRSDFP